MKKIENLCGEREETFPCFEICLHTDCIVLLLLLTPREFGGFDKRERMELESRIRTSHMYLCVRRGRETKQQKLAFALFRQTDQLINSSPAFTINRFFVITENLILRERERERER